MIGAWSRSLALHERACRSLTGGVSSPVRTKAPIPLYFANGQGPRLFDVDGNEYIDYQLAWGPNILGYNHPRMVQAMRRQAERPYSYGAQHEMEITVAERVSFTSSGCLMPKPGYLQAEKDLTHLHGALLVFDEVITGFCMAVGGTKLFWGYPGLRHLGEGRWWRIAYQRGLWPNGSYGTVRSTQG